MNLVFSEEPPLEETGLAIVLTCLLLVKFRGLKVEQLLSTTRKANAGNNCLTITSFFLG
jgi:hypothetical protein